MQRVQSGKLDELTELFDRYQVRIFNYLLRLCRERDTAEDLTQGVFERVIKYRDSFKREHTFKTWIYQIARNLFKDHWRKNSVMFSEYTDISQIEEQASTSHEALEKSESYEALFQALDLLTPERKELLVLSKFQEMKYEEISEITGMTVSAIKVNIHRAIKQLRAFYFATS